MSPAVETVEVRGAWQGEDRMALVTSPRGEWAFPLDPDGEWHGWLVNGPVRLGVAVRWQDEWEVASVGVLPAPAWFHSYGSDHDTPVLRVIAPTGTKPESN